MKPLRKAVFPVAGLGTRFLPATKAIPKEMLPIVDKPLIQYAVEEARAAGIDQFCMITGRGKTALVEHFDVAYELEDTLRRAAKTAALEFSDKNPRRTWLDRHGATTDAYGIRSCHLVCTFIYRGGSIRGSPARRPNLV